MDPIVEIRGISKKYTIRHESQQYVTLRDSLASLFRATTSDQEDFEALHDISFSLNPGESLGVIGRNGAGKSTLLKILSKITPPSQGSIVTRGRLASLLEVGTGFHPELTGRENIFFNGSILGMKRNEIKASFDEIVDFAGTEKFLDTPLKHYSSGMQLRLAFAVAAFLKAEILVIDEVLAVGDIEFQKKCIGKMEDVSRDGRTILFVSHNMAAVQSLCSSALWLHDGRQRALGAVGDVVREYQEFSSGSSDIKLMTNNRAWLTAFTASAASKPEPMMSNTPGCFTITIESKVDIADVTLGIGVNDLLGVRIFTLFSKFLHRKYDLRKGTNTFKCEIGNVQLKPGLYYAEIYVGDGVTTTHVYYDYHLKFEVFAPSNMDFASIPDASQGHFLINQSWS
jgi:lipopolysaccharide transport system ATP-binding protein